MRSGNRFHDYKYKLLISVSSSEYYVIITEVLSVTNGVCLLYFQCLPARRSINALLIFSATLET
jgi:hypothetical protein